jgi:TRAP-type C4-dicarboxylate transport system permease small subunit
MNAAGSVWILLLILLVSADALGRSFFLHPIVGTTELVTLSIVGIVFMQLPDTVRGGRLTRSDSLLAVISPRAACLLQSLFCLLGAVFMALGLWGSVPLLIEAVERRHWIGNEGVFTAPVWPVKTIIVVGLAACLVLFVRQAASALRRAAHWK